MGLLDEMKQDDEKQKTTAMLEALTSTLPAVERQLTKLTKAVADLTGFLKVMDEQQDRRLKELSTSPPSEQPSTPQLDDDTKSRIFEIERTLAAVASQLTSSAAVMLPDGSRVKSSDLDALSLVKRMEARVETMGQNSADLADVVRKRGTIRIDTDKLTEHAVKVLDARLARAVEPSALRIESRLAEFEERVAAAGAENASELTTEVAVAVAKADEVVSAVRTAEHRLETLTARVTWTAVGRMSLALLPLAAVIMVVGGLTTGAFYALGIGPLLGWAWSSFEAAELPWVKALIAVGTLAGVGAFGWVCWRAAHRLGDAYRGW